LIVIFNHLQFSSERRLTLHLIGFLHNKANVTHKSKQNVNVHSISNICCAIKMNICHKNTYRVVQKTAQSLWHHNFATVHHRVMRFLAKCFERNSLRDLS